jgi:chemotaxis protein CheC
MQDELDILREVGSIISAHGSIALSKILERKISLSFPSTEIISYEKIYTKINLDETGIAVISDLATGLDGKILFLLDEKNAFKVMELSYKIKDGDKKASTLTETGMSLIKEIGNIVMGTSTSALSLMIRKPILALPPTLISGTIERILKMALSGQGGRNYALLIEAVFEQPQEKINGGFYLILSTEAAAEIKRICKEDLERLKRESF